MPYPVLDRLEKLIVRDHLSCEHAAETCANEFPQYSPEEHLLWAQRFFTLWTRNQWKRERYALGFHLDDETLPPNEWGQYPFFIG